MSLPTNAALDRAVAELVTRCAPYVRIGEALTAIRRMQDHATLESVGRIPGVPTATRPHGEPVVLRMEDYRRVSPECHDDEPEAA
jgi:hypothetical protein